MLGRHPQGPRPGTGQRPGGCVSRVCPPCGADCPVSPGAMRSPTPGSSSRGSRWMRRSSRTPWRGSCEGVRGSPAPACPLVCVGVCRGAWAPRGLGRSPCLVLSAPFACPHAWSPPLSAPPCPALGITPSQVPRGRVRASPEAAGRAEGALGDQLQGWAQTAPQPRCSPLARLGRPQAMGWVSRLRVAGGTTTVTGRRPGRSYSWGRRSRLQAGACPLGPPRPPRQERTP